MTDLFLNLIHQIPFYVVISTIIGLGLLILGAASIHNSLEDTFYALGIIAVCIAGLGIVLEVIILMVIPSIIYN